MALKMNEAELNAFLVRVFDQVANQFHVEEVSEGGAILRLKIDHSHLRPGGTVSGPSMFGLVDVAMYTAVLAHIGPKALAVTTNCSIDFMRKPEGGRDLLGHCRLLKLGKSLAVGDVVVTAAGDDVPLAHASLTYAIPPQGSRADVDA